MQPKVSIVIPCYNKVKWIGGMFASIIAQKWDNIEVVLVNDGSTDGTREVIAEYEPEFLKRGYEVVIIDQDNQGVAAAVRNGLRHMSGEYFCTIDSDDRIAPDYMTLMTGFLRDNPEYDAVSCAYVVNKGYIPERDIIWNHTAESSNRLENYILLRMEISACNYVIKTDYLNKCNVIQNFQTTPKLSQEPSILVPIFAGGGKFKHISKGLYLRNTAASDKTRNDTFIKAKKMAEEYYELIRAAVKHLEMPPEQKDQLLKLAELGLLKAKLNWTNKFSETKAHQQQWLADYAELLCRHFDVPFEIGDISITNENMKIFFNAVEKWMFYEPLFGMHDKPKGRIIGYGVLGKNARELLPFLEGTPYFPDLLWDISTQDTSQYKGKNVTVPDFPSVTRDDLIIVFPISYDIEHDIKNNLDKYNTDLRMLSYAQMLDYVGMNLFPELSERKTDI
jgi:glycosyltransferase involved in cell wall biosynthesis